MTLIAAIGVPIVLTYTTTVYYIFRGKVKIGKDSYLTNPIQTNPPTMTRQEILDLYFFWRLWACATYRKHYRMTL
jgi:hypothetical protein